jgi:hypothetical protein
MVVKIPKKLEMKSLLPAPCSPLPAHVLAFPADKPSDQIRKLVADKSQAEESKKLRDENAALNLELGALISENQAARMQARAALAAAERIRMFAH